jgi:hypothetical protein
MDKNTVIWKLLKYATPDCLNMPDLTKSEISQLIYKGQPDSSEYRVFLDSCSNEDLTSEVKTMLRIFPTRIYPESRVLSQVDITFQCISHNKINMLNTYEPRSLLLLKEVLSQLNGQSIGGIGLLGFDNSGGIRSNIAQYNLFSGNFIYKGYTAVMSTRTG